MPFQCVLMALLSDFCVAGNSEAQLQVTVSQGDCSEHSPCTQSLTRRMGTYLNSTLRALISSGLAKVAIVSTAGMSVLQDKAAVVKNEPYQAQAVTEMKQTLADGSHIVQTNHGNLALTSMEEPCASRN